MRAPSWWLVSMLAFGCGDCLGGGGDDGGGSGGGSGGSGGSSALTYTLTEATGEWNLTGSTDPRLSCVSTTTSSKTTLVLPAPVAKAANFVPGAGFFSALAKATLTVGKIEGTRTCTTGTPKSCPLTPALARDEPLFLIVAQTKPLPPNAPDGMAFIPELSISLPKFCEPGVWELAKAPVRGRPITVAELKSGRFVVEGSGTVAVTERVADPGEAPSSPLTGKLTYSFRLVFQTTTYDAANAVTPPAFVTYEECTHDLTPTTADLDAARTALAAGGTDIPLNANGCRRMKITRTATGETRRHELTRGTLLTYDAVTGKTTASRDAVVTYEIESDAMGSRERFDSDHDGVFEATGETKLEAGQWKSSTMSDLSPTHTVEQQVTRTRIDATTMTVLFEENGAQVESYVAALKQEGCFDKNSVPAMGCAQPAGVACSGPLPDVCTAAQLDTLKPKITEALKKGKECLDKIGLKGYDPTGKSVDLAIGMVDFVCTTRLCDPYGFFDASEKPNKHHDLLLNLAKANGTELSRAIFHEMLHSDPRFSHDDDLVKNSGKACKTQLLDRTYACEQLCFAQTPTSCDCIRCLTPDGKKPTKEVCRKCAGYGGCAGRQEPNGAGGMRPVATTVGAWCKDRTFCDTKAECDTACGMLGPCKQVKATCNDACN